MKTGINGLNLIKTYEGLKLNPYLDVVGVATIGYGSTMYENGTKVTIHDAPITEERATQLLKNTLTKYENGVNACVHVPLTQNQFDALVSFAYNLGIGNLQSSTLVKMINLKKFDVAAGEFIKWNRAGGKIINGLTIRRIAERDLFNKE
jgi:lysozyme